MQDRSPKYPGRVKLLPVAGQGNIYDMTRADDPDDTGTPFNKRTMLQDSTSQFLNLPLANPFVDDAFRHVVDRAVPIGTIRTSPVQSMGDAWLKCDGSAVTYGNYPQLCQLLRNSTEAVTWSSNAFPTSYSIEKASNPVWFDGRWIVAVADASTTIWILSAETLDGTWTLEKTISANTSTTQFSSVVLRATADDNYCVIAYRLVNSSNKRNIGIAAIEKGTSEWASNTLQVSDGMTMYYLLGVGNCDGRFAVAMSGSPVAGDSNSHDIEIHYTRTPTQSAQWEKKSISALYGNSYIANARGSFSCANGKWIIVTVGMGETYITKVYGCDDFALFEFDDMATITLGSSSVNPRSVSEAAYFNGKYYFTLVKANSVEVFSSADLGTWTSSTVETATQPEGTICSASAGNTMLAIANSSKIWTSTIPSESFTEVATQDASVCGLKVNGNVIAASSLTGFLYYDYTYASKLLPTISLSDDTTTFIKAKNELNVFESQQSGGGD